jgi:hypothetical protein
MLMGIDRFDGNQSQEIYRKTCASFVSLYTQLRKKAEKNARPERSCSPMAVTLRSKRFKTRRTAINPRHSQDNRGQEAMSGPGNKAKDDKSVKNGDKANKPAPKVGEDDDVEDGDIATPKRDRDDEQQDL